MCRGSRHSGGHVGNNTGRLTLGIWPLELDIGRYNPVLKRQNALNQATQPRRPLRVSDVRLHGADVDTTTAKNVADSVGLDRVSRRGTGTVALGLWLV